MSVHPDFGELADEGYLKDREKSDPEVRWEKAEAVRAFGLVSALDASPSLLVERQSWLVPVAADTVREMPRRGRYSRAGGLAHWSWKRKASAEPLEQALRPAKAHSCGCIQGSKHHPVAELG